jgi:hypothetical protein
MPARRKTPPIQFTRAELEMIAADMHWRLEGGSRYRPQGAAALGAARDVLAKVQDVLDGAAPPPGGPTR